MLISLFSLLSCSSDNNSSDPLAPSSSGNVDYEFTVTINGVVHKVKGNTKDLISQYGTNSVSYASNYCIAGIDMDAGIILKIGDITQKEFISGQAFFLAISIPNCQLGKNQAKLQFINSPVLEQFNNSKKTGGLFVEKSGTYCYYKNNSCQFPFMDDYVNKITLNISDLGNSPSINTDYNSMNTGNILKYGNTFKGNYSGTVYFSPPFPLSASSAIFNIPMQLSIDFKAVRTE